MTVAPAVHPSVRAAKQQGDKAYTSRDFAAAVERYSEAIDNIEDAVVLSNRSATYAQRRRFDKALGDAERALKLQPSWPRLHHRHGHALFHLGRYSDAIQAFEVGLKLDPEDSALKEGLAKLQGYTEAAASDNVGELESEPAEPEPACSLAPATPATPEAAPGATSPSGRKPGAFSARAGAPATPAMPSSPSAGTGADETGPTTAELREKGNNFFRTGKYSAAIRAYDEAIRSDKSDARSWANRAAAQMALLAEFGKGMPPDKMRGNPYYNNALSDLTQALSMDSKYIKAWARKGQLHSMVGDLQQAVNAFERGLMIDPGSQECRAGRDACRAQGA